MGITVPHTDNPSYASRKDSAKKSNIVTAQELKNYSNNNNNNNNNSEGSLILIHSWIADQRTETRSRLLEINTQCRQTQQKNLFLQTSASHQY